MVDCLFNFEKFFQSFFGTEIDIKRNIKEWQMGYFTASFECVTIYFPCPSQIYNYLRLPTSRKPCIYNSLPKLGVSYTIGNIVLVSIQQYMACLIWRKTALDMADKSFGFFEVSAQGTT
jgi:hypothetical protein